ncbi:MAG TPA: hypothetical protein EYQ18_03935 [Candidatus Handelsmanbacteria bacterium]|nr:hypothetical protein [Candidatus Handelsmanbacteria bacterium]
MRPLEDAILPEVETALPLATKHDVIFAGENNSTNGLIFALPDRCIKLLDQVPNQSLVWDQSHTLPKHVADGNSNYSRAK